MSEAHRKKRVSPRRRFGVLLLALSLAVTAGCAGRSLRAMETAPHDTDAQIFRAARLVEDALMRIHTLRADFVQYVLPHGPQDTGQLLLKRPGLMRIDYDPPNTTQIFADGRNIILRDKSADRRTEIALSLTPASLILDKNVSLSVEKVFVEQVRREESLLFVTLKDARHKDRGHLVLVLQDQESDPRLLGWDVVDAAGITTRVALRNPRYGIDLPRRVFLESQPRLEK